MASGHVNRIKRPNTWLHRPMLQNVKKALANPEPSTHDPTETSSGIGSAINLKSANAPGIDVPATLLGAPPSVLWVAHGHDLMMRGQHSLAG